MYVIYLKKFDDGSVYVGSTKNFEERMRNHKKYSKKEKYAHLPIYKKYKECKHKDFILIKNIPTYELAIFLEENITSNYRKHGYEVLNILDGRKRNDGLNNNPIFNIKGEGNISAKPMEYYEKTPVLRSSFKRTCKRMDWDFNNFEEIFAEWYIRPNDKTRRPKNFYKLKRV